MSDPTEDQFWEQFAKDAPALEVELEREFGTPEQVIAQEKERLYREVHDSLTGMPEEQAEWEGEPGPHPHHEEPMRPYPASKLDFDGEDRYDHERRLYWD